MGTNGVTIDASKPFAAIKRIISGVEGARDYSDEDIAREILRLSQLEVPHDKGDLQNSGVAERDGKYWVVGYNMAYAHRLHEHPEYKFQKGRKGKYLEDPVKNNEKELGIRWGKNMGQKLLK